MLRKGAARYEAVTTGNQSDHTQRASLEKNAMVPRQIESVWGTKIIRIIFDLTVAMVALLFVGYGLLVYRYDRKPVYPGSRAASIVSIAKYVCIPISCIPYDG